MKINIILTFNIILMVLVTPEVYSQVEKAQIEDPVEYFNKRTEALSLVKNEKWQELIPIAEKLTQQYKMDGDLFYILGLAYYETEQYQSSIEALKQTLNCGGTILNDIPTGSAPSNDIMIKIAKGYALIGDKSNALLWLQKGFSARYDEKPFLRNDPVFKDFGEDEDFLQLFGYKNQVRLTRKEAWISDLEYLEKRINELHYNPYHLISKATFDKSISKLKSNIGALSEEEIVVELMKIFGGLGNGHNLIIPTTLKSVSIKRLPVQFYQFDDGIFVVDAEEDFKQWIGYELKSIGSILAEEALQITNAVNARDNDMQTLWLGPYYMGLPGVLAGLGIIDNKNRVQLILKDTKGRSQKVIMTPITWNFNGFPKMPQLKNEAQPIYLSKMNDPYWYKLMKEENSIYIQLNSVTNKENQTLSDFNVELRKQIAKNETQNLILDLRHNHGGDGSLLPPMLKTLNRFEVMNPKGKIFVIMGRETFSAGHNLLTKITQYTSPILVGEPSGSKPNHIGESGWFQLPYSGLMGLISTQFHQDSKAEDNRKWISPHIPVTLSSTDYFNGNDKALGIIKNLIKTAENRNRN
jgi:tetratricopeptide (TPR) repeat protein